MHFCTSSAAVPPPQLSICSHPLQVVRSTGLLGITLDDQLNWKQHVTNTIRSTSYKIYMLQRLRFLEILAAELKEVYTFFILPKLMYASSLVLISEPRSTPPVWEGLEESIQNNSRPHMQQLRKCSLHPEFAEAVYQTWGGPKEIWGRLIKTPSTS